MILVTSPHFNFEFHPNGTLSRILHNNICLNLFPGNALESGPTNIFLRRLTSSGYEVHPLLGPESNAVCSLIESNTGDCLQSNGEWQGIAYSLSLRPSSSQAAWFWHVSLENKTTEEAQCDLLYIQDLGLADYGLIRLNEHYVSQYIDHQPLEHDEGGILLGSRQNLPMGQNHPWLLIGSLNKGSSFATDALDVFSLQKRLKKGHSALRTRLPGKRRQGEHSMAALQDSTVTLSPGETQNGGFFAWFEAHHPDATSESDLKYREKALALKEASPIEKTPLPRPQSHSRSLFCTSPYLSCLELSSEELEELFGKTRRNEERSSSGKLLSFFTADNEHIVLSEKEAQVLRPHGMILRSGSQMTPSESSLTSTVWMSGVFNSMLTQGHVSINRLLSTNHSYLSLFCSHGQRLFMEIAGSWHQLGTPSAFSMSLNECRWIYKHSGGLLEVTSKACLHEDKLDLRIEVQQGEAQRFLLSNHIALGGDDGITERKIAFEDSEQSVFIKVPKDSELAHRFPEKGFRLNYNAEQIETVSDDALLFEDKTSHQQAFLTLLSKPCKELQFSYFGELLEKAPEEEKETNWQTLAQSTRFRHTTASSPSTGITAISEILPWFVQNAFIHYLSPRGLEQYSGGGWGTRDVVQGPLEMLLSYQHESAIADILRTVFRNQNPDGDWPQWFMFFERERNIRPEDSHGDIVLWPLLALGEYLLSSGDKGFLDEELPFFHHEGENHAERASVREHLERARNLARARLLPESNLISYGNGDWNDSLQPNKESLKKELVSSWTVTLHYQSLQTLADAFSSLGLRQESESFYEEARGILEDFQKHLLPDGIVAGFLRDGDKRSYLLHPRDEVTGLHYSILPMIHGVISNMLNPEQARAHLRLIEEHLSGADGARLFDKPLEYRGGIQKNFQRAESSSFFGREIGLMYTHAHLRYAQALAHLGEAQKFFRALMLVNPIGLPEILGSAALRQSNCYYSSSDAAFSDRYEAFEQYDLVNTGEIPFEGGWRVYSSGGGIYVGLLHRCLLGVRKHGAELILDPVLPKELSGLEADITFENHPITLKFEVTQKGYAPSQLRLNGSDLEFARTQNPYREGGAKIGLSEFRSLLKDVNTLEITLS